jgi:hypothetical protein
MTDAINNFFENYPDAPCVHEVAGQLFHDNAKDAAEARAAFYGLKVETHNNPKETPTGTEGVAATETTEGNTDVAVNTEGVAATETTEGNTDVAVNTEGVAATETTEGNTDVAVNTEGVAKTPAKGRKKNS